MQASFPERWFKAIDARPLPIGGYSKDRDAGYGYAGTGMAKGYKLYGIWNGGGSLAVWQVHPMNVNEVTVAKKLIGQVTGEGYVVGDRMYDASPLPSWVRGLHRVRLWAQGKIVINAVRLALKQRLIA